MRIRGDVGLISDNAVINFQPGRLSQGGIRDNPDTGQNQLGFKHRATGQMDRCNPARSICFQAFCCLANVKLDAVLAVQGRAMIRQRGAGHTGQQTRGQFNQMNIKIKPAQRGRGFQPDIAATDHHSCAHMPQASPQRARITSGAQHMQIRGPVRQVRQRPGISPGRQHKMIIRQGAAICQAELLLTGAKRGHRTSRPEGDLEIVKPVLLAQGKGPFPIGKISFEIGFGQRRALQRQTRVTFQDRDLAVKPARAQTFGTRQARMAGPDNHNMGRCGHHHFRFLFNSSLSNRQTR